MYYRLYASKTNTILSSNTTTNWAQDKNTGSNTIMELSEGKVDTKLLFSFQLPEWLREKIGNFENKINLKIFDAGTLFEPVLNLKRVKLYYFNEDFIEGNGWSFNKNKATPGISNWIKRDEINLWSNVTLIPITEYHLNKNNEDLTFNVRSVVGGENVNTNFMLSLVDPMTLDPNDNNVYTKFLFSRHTRTVFQPYLEFFIEDGINDSTHTCIAGNNNDFYLINENGMDFTGVVTAQVDGISSITNDISAVKKSNGVYFITLTPDEPDWYGKKEYFTITWSIDNKPVYKQTIEVKPENMLTGSIDWANLFFYVTTPYTNNIVRQGDVIPFEIISQIRGKGDVVNNNYEYRVLSADGFEVLPWTKANVYRDKMFFNVKTDYFHPELSYEVFVRNNKPDFSVTSNLTFKFKLTQNTQSHLRELSASPYYSREYFFSK